MFSKPISLILVYVITVINIMVLISPFTIALLPLINMGANHSTLDNGMLNKLQLVFCFIFFVISFLMLFYLFLDFLFGFSVRSSLKNCKRFDKIKDYDFLSDIFDQVKTKFGEKNVRLYVKNSDEINAYAVSSFNKKAIVLTHGLIKHYLVECSDPKKFLNALRSIIGHEMSHLVNKDFLPGFLIITNQKVTNFVSSVLTTIFRVITQFFVMIPAMRQYSYIMTNLYSVTRFLLTFFNRFVVYNVYEFLRRFISRSLEFRCDYQSARAFGGHNMALALSMLGKGGYFTLFSTHPGTAKRIAKVQNVKITESMIGPRFFDSIANYFSIMFLMIICLYFAKTSGVDVMIRSYLQHNPDLYLKVQTIFGLIKNIL